jgi:hypothetical protein
MKRKYGNVSFEIKFRCDDNYQRKYLMVIENRHTRVSFVKMYNFLVCRKTKILFGIVILTNTLLLNKYAEKYYFYLDLERKTLNSHMIKTLKPPRGIYNENQNFSKLASTGTKQYGLFRGVAGFCETCFTKIV